MVKWAMPTKCKRDPEWFWSHFTKGEGCWEWPGYRVSGYGRTTYRGLGWPAHKLAYHFAKGPVPRGLVVRHTCDNRPCCNPSHLVLGTLKKNAADMWERGRAYWQQPHARKHPGGRTRP